MSQSRRPYLWIYRGRQAQDTLDSHLGRGDRVIAVAQQAPLREYQQFIGGSATYQKEKAATRMISRRRRVCLAVTDRHVPLLIGADWDEALT